MKIGLLGGSFNPIHNAHVILGRTICDRMGLDEVWFLVSPHNPLKDSDDLLDENLRFEMVQLALQDDPKLKASDYEFHLPRPSFTWNTLQSLRHDYPEHTFYLLIGGDNWDKFPKWRNNEDILREFHIIIYPREDSDIAPDTLPANVSLVETPKINVSSTMIRNMIAAQEDFSHYVNSRVKDYICARKLYL